MASNPVPVVESPREGLIVRFLITPLTFISFLFSLALIDAHNSSVRSAPDQPRSLLSRMIWKDSPEPYAYVRSPHPKEGASPEGKGTREPWHWHSKQKKMMKMEVADAFEIRKWVLTAMLVLGGVLVVVSWIVFRWLLRLW
ncbi:hypothetical protein PVAG01_10967 [Phlyctema vagabunda]|uniref:ATP synthase F0 subunit 8 n=1 Tax=Phlyctema vagabunda TaxID=108571 RepID=A0ABR4P3W8_9HELO